MTLVGDLGGLLELAGLDVAVERGEEVLDGDRLCGGGRRLRLGRHRGMRATGGGRSCGSRGPRGRETRAVHTRPRCRASGARPLGAVGALGLGPLWTRLASVRLLGLNRAELQTGSKQDYFR